MADRLIDGMTIAAIAADLALTESRVNQIIRALKDRFEVGTQAGIVAAYQQALEADAIEAEDLNNGGESLVPDILNAPHPLLYRFLAICAGAFLLAGTFYLVTHFSIALSNVSATDEEVFGHQRDREN